MYKWQQIFLQRSLNCFFFYKWTTKNTNNISNIVRLLGFSLVLHLFARLWLSVMDSFFMGRNILLPSPRTQIYAVTHFYIVRLLQFVSLIDYFFFLLLLKATSGSARLSVPVSIHQYSFILNVHLEPRLSLKSWLWQMMPDNSWLLCIHNQLHLKCLDPSPQRFL